MGVSPSSTASPGSSLPSRYSRLAPPPVEMWPNASSSKPSVRTAAAESPPPTTESPSTLVSASATTRVPSAKAGVSKTPIGPFQNTVCAPVMASAKARGGVGADVQAQRVGRDRVGGDDPRLRLAVARRELGVDDDVGGQHDADAGVLGALEVLPADLDLVLLEEALPDLVALGLEEGEDHPAADQQRVRLAEQVVDDAELVGDLRAAEHDDVGPLRVLGEPLHHVELGGDQAAHRVREPLRDVVDRRLLAVHHAEPVGDEGVGQLGELVGELAALGVVLAGLAGVEPDVLEHARPRRPRGRPRSRGPSRRRCRSRTRRPGRAARRGVRRPAAASSGPPARPSGRPRCAVTTTRAPASASALMVGTLARIRPSSVIAECRRGAR